MRLAAEPDLSVSELAVPFNMSLPAVMKHLDVLSDAGLVARTKTGRVVACQLHAEPMRDAFEWLNRYEKFWSERLSSLAAFLEEEEDHVHPNNHQAEPHPQAPLQGAARQSLLGLDRPGKNKALDGAGTTQCTLAEFDLRVGGRYRWLMRAPSGEKHRRPRRVSRSRANEKLVYTWAWNTTPERESLVTVVFKPDGDGILLTLTHEQFSDRDARDRHQHGWNGALDKMEKLSERKRSHRCPDRTAISTGTS